MTIITEVRVGGGRFRLNKKIGKGATGYVIRGTDLAMKDAVAIKLEFKNRRSHHLEHERDCYMEMAGEVGIPRVRWFGCESDYNVLVMDRVGENLNELQQDCGGKFSLSTVLILAGQMISRLESLHKHGLVHCDVKPSNFAVGRSAQSHCIFLIDLDLAKRYIDPATGRHIEETKGSYAGTDRFASRHTHRGIVPSRRDDLESLGYTLLYFLKGTLPWQSLDKRYYNIEAKRKQINRLKCCSEVIQQLLKDQPPPFASYLHYVCRLGFNQTPNYDYLRCLFWDLFERLRFCYEHGFDWDRLPLSNAGTDGQPKTVLEEYDWTSRDYRLVHIREALGLDEPIDEEEEEEPRKILPLTIESLQPLL